MDNRSHHVFVLIYINIYIEIKLYLNSFISHIRKIPGFLKYYFSLVVFIDLKQLQKKLNCHKL